MAGESRRALLDRVVDHLAAAGLTDQSLRALAADVGTSHRMLIYHFGSYDGLVLAVVREVEARQRAFVLSAAGDPGSTLTAVTLALWDRIAAPDLRELERLFFGLYARLLQQGQLDLAAELVSSWVEPAVALLVARGIPAAEAAALARLGLAVSRGLLLDLLATGDRAGVDAAMHAYVTTVFAGR